MASKVHLQANKAETMEAFSFCASVVDARGRVRFNGRQSYRYMASTIVRGAAFAATPEAERCAHCMDVLRQRKHLRPQTFAAVFKEG